MWLQNLNWSTLADILIVVYVLWRISGGGRRAN